MVATSLTVAAFPKSDVEVILKEVDEYMTDPDTLFSTAEYNMMHGRMEACNEVMRVLEDNEDYDYVESLNKEEEDA